MKTYSKQDVGRILILLQFEEQVDCGNARQLNKLFVFLDKLTRHLDMESKLPESMCVHQDKQSKQPSKLSRNMDNWHLNSKWLASGGALVN